MKPYHLAVVLVLGSAPLLVGCSKPGSSTASSSSPEAAASDLSVKEQCDALDKANAQWQDKVTNRKDTEDAAKDALRMANDVTAWSAAIGKLPIGDPELKKLVTEEQGVLKDESAALKELGAMLAKTEPSAARGEKGLDGMQKQMDALEKREDATQAARDAIEKKIDSLCADK